MIVEIAMMDLCFFVDVDVDVAAYNVANALFAGSAPAIQTALVMSVHTTPRADMSLPLSLSSASLHAWTVAFSDSRLFPAYYIMSVACVSLITLVVAFPNTTSVKTELIENTFLPREMREVVVEVKVQQDNSSKLFIAGPSLTVSETPYFLPPRAFPKPSLLSTSPHLHLRTQASSLSSGLPSLQSNRRGTGISFAHVANKHVTRPRTSSRDDNVADLKEGIYPVSDDIKSWESNPLMQDHLRSISV